MDHEARYKLCFGLIGPAWYTPIPSGHRFVVGDGVFGDLGIEDGDPAAPFEVTDQGASEFGIGGQPDLVGSIEEKLHPALALWFVEHFPDMVGDHDGVTAGVLLRIFLGSSEDFSHEVGNMPRMIRGHALEDRTDEGVLQDFIVKDFKQMLKGFFASGPLIKGGNGWFHTNKCKEDGGR